jgi:hypothetical protein
MHAGPHVFSNGLGHEAPLVVTLPAGKPGTSFSVVIVRKKHPFRWKLDYTPKASAGPNLDTLIMCEQDEARSATDFTRSGIAIVRQYITRFS